MSSLREAAQQALEALETFRDISDFTPAAAVYAITALRAALSTPDSANRSADSATAFCNSKAVAHTLNCVCGATWDIGADGSEELVHAPDRRKPLTDEQVRDLWSWSMTPEAERTATTQQHAFARAIERAHGITGDSNGS